MRITYIYDLEEKPKQKKKIAEALIEDIISLAHTQIKSRHKKFQIKIRLEPIEEKSPYKWGRDKMKTFSMEDKITLKEVHEIFIAKTKVREVLDTKELLNMVFEKSMYEEMKNKGYNEEQATIMLKMTANIIINSFKQIKIELGLADGDWRRNQKNARGLYTTI